MTKLDFYWKSKKEWYHLTENGDFVVNDNAPEEAKKSYQNYLKEFNRKYSRKREQVTLIDGTKEQREEIMREFFGLKSGQTYQDLDVEIDE